MFRPDPSLFGNTLEYFLTRFDSLPLVQAAAATLDEAQQAKFAWCLQGRVQPTKGKRMLGEYWLRDRSIRLSPLPRDSEAGFAETLRHEVAHMLDHIARPNQRLDHGPEWQRWARMVKAACESSTADEQFMIAAESSKKIVARCDACDYVVTRHRRSDFAGYVHRGCHGSLWNYFETQAEADRFGHYDSIMIGER